MHKFDKEVKPWMIASYISGAGILLVAYILAGFMASRWMVTHFGASKLWIAIGTIVGLFLGITNIIIIIYKLMGEQDNG